MDNATALPQWKHDSEVNAGYLTISNEPVFRTEVVEPRILIDYDVKGCIVGIETL